MIEEKIVVSDSNIFFDLYSVGLLNEFFALPCDITTTDFVIEEIENENQQKEVQNFITSKELEIISFDETEFNKIISIFLTNNNNASITDCSVWYYAKKVGGRLLSGDRKLKKSAENDGVKVSGILYILDNLIEYGILDKKVCANKLEDLLKINSRLPKGESERRILQWRSF